MLKYPFRDLKRQRRASISYIYVYLVKNDYDIKDITNMALFHKAIQSPRLDIWMKAIEEEMQLIKENKVWDLVELPEGYKPISCKWVFQTNRDSNRRIDIFKARLVAKWLI